VLTFLSGKTRWVFESKNCEYLLTIISGEERSSEVGELFYKKAIHPPWLGGGMVDATWDLLLVQHDRYRFESCPDYKINYYV
jgi:hypothetical protein